MKIPTRILASLTVLTLAGIAAAIAEPPASSGSKEPVVKVRNSQVPKSDAVKQSHTKVETKGASDPAGHEEDQPATSHTTKEPRTAPATTTHREPKTDHAQTDRPSPEDALKQLEEGNTRWVSGSENGANLDARRRTDTAENGQTPFAAILTCADSRIPVEHVFDQGVGDLFVVRVAGNTAGMPQTGSLEYGVEHLHTSVLVVLGHTKCGAVSAAATHADVHGNIAALVKTIEPSVERAQKLNPTLGEKDLVPAAIRENVWQSVFDVLKSSEPCRTAVAKGELKVVGAVYDISTGKVEWLGEHPWQSELIAAFSKEQGTREASATDGHSDGGH